MTCKCRVVPIRTGQTQFTAGDFAVEHCRKHAMNERLAEALREYAGLDAACPPRIQKLLQKYDSIVEGEKES